MEWEIDLPKSEEGGFGELDPQATPKVFWLAVVMVFCFFLLLLLLLLLSLDRLEDTRFELGAKEERNEFKLILII